MTDRDGGAGSVDDAPDGDPEGRGEGPESLDEDSDGSDGAPDDSDVDQGDTGVDRAILEVDPAVPEVEPAPTGVERRLDPRVRLLWVGQALLSALVLGTVAAVAGFALRGWGWPGPAVLLIVFALGASHALLRYRRWCYEVRDDALYLERGVLTEVRTVVPYVRLQHVDVSRGPVERALGLATVVVYTAGSRGADVTVPGLTPEDADALQARLKRLAIAAEGDDAV